MTLVCFMPLPCGSNAPKMTFMRVKCAQDDFDSPLHNKKACTELIE